MRTTISVVLLGLLSACTAGDSPANGGLVEGPTFAPVADRAGISVAPLAPFPDTPLGREAARGLAIVSATRDSLPGHVGNGLRCTTCHLDEGRRAFAMPWVGVTARYPQYRSRAAAVLTVEDRIQECLERSLAGRRLPDDDPRLRAMLAYFAHLSAGTVTGRGTVGQGIDSARAGAPDPARGATLYVAQCARCHGADGAGTTLATPLWGPGAYTIAAGMSRFRMAAGFIKHNMPFDAPGTLSDQDAVNVAAYINAQPRPDFAGKERDWPKGGAPADVPFRTIGSR